MQVLAFIGLGRSSARHHRKHPLQQQRNGRGLAVERLEPRELLSLTPFSPTQLFKAYGGFNGFVNQMNRGGDAAWAKFWSQPEVRANVLANLGAQRAAEDAMLDGLFEGDASAAAASQSAAASAAALSYSFDVVAKAKPDEWYNGEIGMPYTPLGTQAPSAPGQPKVNQDYLWGMTQTGDYIWYGTAANALAQAAGAIGAAGLVPTETKTYVIEGPESTYPLVPDTLRPFLGDWRPPEIHRYNMKTGVDQVMTPNNPLILRTLGLRSAGANNDVVLLAGPTIYYSGMNLFAFNAKTGAFIGSRRITQYSDIRNWVNYNGQLYAGVLKAYSRTGEGAVIRWRGTLANPFAFQEVGRLDLEAANLTVHNGRLYATTWPLGYASLMGMLGYRSTAKAGLWMSPVLGTAGLNYTAARRWQKVWSIDQYEADPVLAKSYGGGSLESFNGYLYWGTMQVPGTGEVVFHEAYPNYDAEVEGSSAAKTTRAIALFRGKDFENARTRKIEVLYGDTTQWKYDPTVANPAARWSQAPTKGGTPILGAAGIKSAYNFYTWSMAVYDNRLYLGTYDVGTTGIGSYYVDLKGNVVLIEAVARSLGYPDLWMGADLYAFEPDVGGKPVDAVVVSNTGAGNPLNHGIRNMESTKYGLFLGTASCANLMTGPPDDPAWLKAGGWELIHVDIAPAVAASKYFTQTSTLDAPNDTKATQGALVDSALMGALDSEAESAPLAASKQQVYDDAAASAIAASSATQSSQSKTVLPKAAVWLWEAAWLEKS